MSGPGSSVGIATDYGLDSPGSNPVEAGRKSIHASMVCGPQWHKGIGAYAVPGPVSGGMYVTQCCTWATKCVNLAFLCRAKWGGREMCARCTASVVHGREVDRMARWCDNVLSPMNTLTSGTMLAVSVTHVLECTQCTWIKVCWLKKSLWGRDFPSVQTGPGAHPASCTVGTGSFPGVKCGPSVLLTTHSLLVRRSWKSRAIPLPTLWATPGL